MPCLFLVPCDTNLPTYCLTDTGTVDTFTQQLITLYNDFQNTFPPGNGPYAPLIRLYNADYLNTPFYQPNTTTPEAVVTCYHVIYTSPGCAIYDWFNNNSIGSQSTLYYTDCDGINVALTTGGGTDGEVCISANYPFFVPSANTVVNGPNGLCSPACECDSTTLSTPVLDIPARPVTELYVSNTLGATYPPIYTVYENQNATGFHSTECSVCNTALWLVNCETGDIIEVYNSYLGIPGTPPSIADQNWNTVYNGVLSPVLTIGPNPYIPEGSYTVSFVTISDFIPPTVNFSAYDVQDWNTDLLPITSTAADCSSVVIVPDYYRLTECASGNSYILTDNSNTTSGTLANYLNQVVRLTLPTSLTGLPDPVQACVTVYRAFSCPNPPCSTHDLGTITVYTDCTDCIPCYNLTDCNNPGNEVTIATLSNDFALDVNNCSAQCNGCQPSIYMSIPETADPTCWRISNTCRSLDGSAYNIDLFNSPVYDVLCTNNPCAACNSFCYLVEPCLPGLPKFILTNPTAVNNPEIILDQVSEITVVIGDQTPTDLYSGCATITLLDNCNPIGSLYPLTASVQQVVYGTPPVIHDDCDECFTYPVISYKITRCDDDGIFFIVTNDLSTLVGLVISGVVIKNCPETTSLCSSVLPTQCWKVSIVDVPGVYEITYTNVYTPKPDQNPCDCCLKPCN